MTETGDIAAALTKPQKEALLRHGKCQQWGGQMEDHLPRWSGVGRILRELRLIDFLSPTSSLTRVTPSGERVREYLAKEHQHAPNLQRSSPRD